MNDESNRLPISARVSIPLGEIELSAVRAAGPGGQKVNKTSSAMHLRFDIRRSSLPEPIKQRLLTMRDQRISNDGILIIKAQRFRTQEKNRADALERLRTFIVAATRVQKKRRPTKPTRS